MQEIQHALKTLQDASIAADQEIVELRKVTTELSKEAKAAQIELKQQQKVDDALDAERRAQLEAETSAKKAAAAKAKEARLAAAAAKKAAVRAAEAELEARIEARREARKREMDEVYNPSAYLAERPDRASEDEPRMRPYGSRTPDGPVAIA